MARNVARITAEVVMPEQSALQQTPDAMTFGFTEAI